MGKGRIIKNTSSLLIFNIAKILFPFVTLPYLTRVLTTEAYGTVAYIKTVMSYMQIVVDFGFVLSGTKNIVKVREDKKKLEYEIGDIIFARFVLAMAAFLMLGLFIAILPILRGNILYTVLSYLVVFTSIFLMDFLFRGLEIMHVITIRFVVMKTISTALTFVLVKGDEDILWIPLFDIMGSVVAVLLVLYKMRNLKLWMRFHGIKKAIRSIQESFVYFLSNVAATSFNAFSTLMIGVALDATEVAYWSVCMQVATAVQACYTPISDGIYPEMIKNRNIVIVKRALQYLMPVVTMGCIVAYFLAEFGMKLIGGEEYQAAVPVFRLLIPIMFFDLPVVLLGWPVLGAIEKTKEVTLSTALSVLIHFLLLIFLIISDSFTLVNIAIVRSVTELILFLVRFAFCIKYKKCFVQQGIKSTKKGGKT